MGRTGEISALQRLGAGANVRNFHPAIATEISRKLWPISSGVVERTANVGRSAPPPFRHVSEISSVRARIQTAVALLATIQTGSQHVSLGIRSLPGILLFHQDDWFRQVEKECYWKMIPVIRSRGATLPLETLGAVQNWKAARVRSPIGEDRSKPSRNRTLPFNHRRGSASSPLDCH
jgi:hypothetical protein